jgi:hypothetical protein
VPQEIQRCCRSSTSRSAKSCICAMG